MAVTLDALTDGDFTEIDDADAIGNWTASGAMSMDAISTTAPVEGTGAIECRVNAGIAQLLISRGSQDLEDTHIRGWLKLAQGLETVANGGGRLRIGTLTNYGEWNIYGSDRQVVVYNGWMALCVDILRPFDDALGTPPAITAITDSGFRINWLNGNGKDLDVADRVWFGNTIYIEGGTTGDRGTFAEIAVADESSGYGLIRPLAGSFIANSEVAFGEIGTATSFFEDVNQVLLFEDLPVSGSLYKIRHAANSTGTNHVRFGSSSGSGAAKEGTGGIVVKSSGDAPFRVEAIDANMDVADYFGCSLTGPTALYDDALRNVKVEDNGTGFTDITRDANYPYSAGASITSSSVADPSNILCSGAHGFQSGATVVISGHSGSTPSINGTHFATVVDSTNFTIPVNVTVGGTGGSVVSGQTSSAMPATEAANDATYFGHDERFYELNIHMTVAKGGTWTGVWEYHNGSTWESLTDLTDGTANYATTGAQTVTFAIPDDWAANAIDTDTRYWIRFRIDSFTSSGTTPVLGGVSVAMAGDVRLEDAVAEMIGCTLTQMGAVRVRSGAFLKKTLITDSIVPAKHAALDLGDADPSSDTVRDLTITNNINGILLKGSGNVTYNFRNIKFANNTNDVRVDFGASDTVTINVLEDGDAPSISKVDAGTTVNVVASVSVDVNVKDTAAAAIQDASVYIQRAVPTAHTSGAGNTAGDGDLVVTAAIDADQPQVGYLSILDISEQDGPNSGVQGYRHASWTGSTFTFPTTVTFACTGGGTGTALQDSVNDFTAIDILQGDTIRNTTDGSWCVVDSITDTNNIVTTPLEGGSDNTWTSGDFYSVHDLATTLVSGTDLVDVVLSNEVTDASGDIPTLVYDSTQAPTDIIVRVRKSSSGTKYVPQVVSLTISAATGATVNITLQTDTVAS